MVYILMKLVLSIILLLSSAFELAPKVNTHIRANSPLFQMQSKWHNQRKSDLKAILPSTLIGQHVVVIETILK